MDENLTFENFEDGMDVDTIMDTDDSAASGAGLIIGAVGVAAVGLVGLAGLAVYKYRHKIEEWRIKQFEKKGYVVYRPGTSQNEEEFVDEN